MPLFKRNRVFTKSAGPIKALRQAKGGPFMLIMISVGAASLAIFLLVRYAAPTLRKWLGYTDTPVMINTPSPTEPLDMTANIREVLLTSKFRNVSAPAILGEDIFFAAGSDNSGNPKLSSIYMHNMLTAGQTTSPEEIAGITLINDNILSLDVNADYILYFDAKSAGGGMICAYDRNTGAAKQLKEVKYGSVSVKLSGQYAVWTERTGETQDKLYMMDIQSLEMTTLAVFNDSPLGLSQPGVCSGEIIWAAADPNHTAAENFAVIKIQPTDIAGAQQSTYLPDMYVHDPVTNGSARAWTDGNGGADSTLYLSVGGAMPKKVAADVTSYGLGQNFLAYDSGGTIWAYFWKTETLARVSKKTELALLATVSDHAVAWFDITDTTRERDILKYAVLD